MLQRLAQFRVALLDFFEQPHVLDGDDRLVSEGFEKCDLFLGEGTDLDSTNKNCPDRNPFSEQRRSQYRYDLPIRPPKP